MSSNSSNPLAAAFAATHDKVEGTALTHVSVPLDENGVPHPMVDLAAIASTVVEDGIEAIRQDAARVLTRTQDYVLKDGTDVKKLLAALDSKVSASGEVNGFDLADCREYVQRLMVTLKERPEFSTILVDSDYRNIVAFAWAMYDAAALEFEVKAEKASRPKALPAEPKTDKGKADKAKKNAFASAMGAFDLGKL